MPDLAECGLIIFLRFPEKGKVKTRIAETLGEERALAAYKELTSITLQLASALDIPVYLFYDGGIPGDIDQKSFFYKIQIEGNLGQKMRSAFDFVLDRHPKAVIIGSDCPEISKTDIILAFQQLDKNDIVIGPSADGGYYLLGMKEKTPFLFDQIQWSTSTVLVQTVQKIKSMQMSYYLLRTLEDIDDGEQWIRYKGKRM